MQRKEILKGKVYRAKGGLVVRALDTSKSPIAAEVYDFVSQTFSRVERGVKPVDLHGGVGYTGKDVVDAYETLNNAHDIRQLLAQIDAFNEAFKTEAVGPNRVQHANIIRPIKDVKVQVPLDGYGRSVEALSIPATGVASIPGDEFIRFTVSHGVPLVRVNDLTVGGYPGIPLDLITTENVEAIKAEQKRKREQRNRSYEVIDAERKVLTQEVKDGTISIDRLVGSTRYSLSYSNHPDLKARLAAALVAAGLEEYVLTHV